MYFDVLYLNFNWFSGVNWVICPLFWSTPVPPRSISKVGNESRGNFGDFCKMDACQRKWSTQACNKYIPELIRTLRSKQNNCLKYRNRCRSRWGYIFGLSHIRSLNMFGGNAFFLNVVFVLKFHYYLSCNSFIGGFIVNSIFF